MTDIKMSNTFDLPVSDGDFTLVAMNKSTYVSMDRAAVIAINSYDLNQERIAELEEELKETREICDAVAHVGVDFGYGVYVLEDSVIHRARLILEALKEQVK